MEVPQARWLVYFMENPPKMDDDWGYPMTQETSICPVECQCQCLSELAKCQGIT